MNPDSVNNTVSAPSPKSANHASVDHNVDAMQVNKDHIPHDPKEAGPIKKTEPKDHDPRGSGNSRR